MSPPISGFLPGEAEQQVERYRLMPPSQKAAEVAALNRLQNERQRADIRARYGEISNEEMRLHLGVLRLGRETMDKVFGPAALDRVFGQDEASPGARERVNPPLGQR